MDFSERFLAALLAPSGRKKIPAARLAVLMLVVLCIHEAPDEYPQSTNGIDITSNTTEIVDGSLHYCPDNPLCQVTCVNSLANELGVSPSFKLDEACLLPSDIEEREGYTVLETGRVRTTIQFPCSEVSSCRCVFDRMHYSSAVRIIRGDEQMCRASIQGAPKPGATSSSSTPPPLSSGPWPVVAGIVYAVVAAAIMFAVPVITFAKKPNTDDVEGISTDGNSAVGSTISGDGSSTPVERPCTPVEEQGVEVDFVPNRRGNPDGGDPDGNLPIPIQASTDP
jgi:hypothetical protein